jgi:hypothetical protein
MDSGILPKDYIPTMLLHQMLKVCKGFHRINLASDRSGCHMFVQCGVHSERELKMKQSGAGSVSTPGAIGEGQCRCS